MGSGLERANELSGRAGPRLGHVAAAVTLAALLGAAGGCVTPAHMYNQRGVALFNMGRYREALHQFQMAAQMDLTSPDIYYNLGRAYHELGDAVNAEINYDHCLALDPNHSKCRHAQVVLLLEQGRSEEAYASVQRWLAADPANPEPLVELAWLQRQFGRTEQARQQLRYALALDPQHPRALAELGAIYEAEGRPQRALVVYQRALAASPNQTQLATKIAQLRQRVAGSGVIVAHGSSGRVRQTAADIRHPLNRY